MWDKTFLSHLSFKLYVGYEIHIPHNAQSYPTYLRIYKWYKDAVKHTTSKTIPIKDFHCADMTGHWTPICALTHMNKPPADPFGSGTDCSSNM